MIGAVAQQFPPDGSAGSCGSRRVPTCGAPRRRDHQIPVNLPESGQDLGTLGEVERGDDPLLLHPLVDAELIADVAALEHEKLFVELLLELALPLKRQVGGTDDENPFNEARSLSSRTRRPAMMVLPAPASSASRKRTLGSLRRCT